MGNKHLAKPSESRFKELHVHLLPTHHPDQCSSIANEFFIAQQPVAASGELQLFWWKKYHQIFMRENSSNK